MKSDAKELKRSAIFDATYAILKEKGYKSTSMLAVAKAAHASNETMYNWFGDKQGLLAAMIEANAEQVSATLVSALANNSDNSEKVFADRLGIFGDILLQLLTGENSVALNRAAAADVATGNVLGALLAENGRNKVAPLLAQLFQEAQSNGILGNADAGEIAEVYIALLLGDVQIRRVIGVMNQPETTNTRTHSQRVCELILQLFGPSK